MSLKRKKKRVQREIYLIVNQVNHKSFSIAGRSKMKNLWCENIVYIQINLLYWISLKGNGTCSNLKTVDKSDILDTYWHKPIKDKELSFWSCERKSTSTYILCLQCRQSFPSVMVWCPLKNIFVLSKITPNFIYNITDLNAIHTIKI